LVRCDVVSQIIEHLESALSISSLLVNGRQGPVVSIGPQAFTTCRSSDDDVNSFMSIIIQHAMKAERLYPGTFLLTVRAILENLKQVRSGIPVRRQGKNVSVSREAVSRAATRHDLDELLAACLDGTNEEVSTMIREAIDLAGHGGRIIVEKSSNSNNSIELVSGYTFAFEPSWPVTLKETSPKIICIDGYVESVSELHRLFQETSETGSTVLLFVRALSDDVKHTIKVNNDRGTLRVIPVIVPFELEGINTLNDVSIAAGCRLITSLLGDVISNVTLADSSVVESCSIAGRSISFVQRSTMRSVFSHVRELRTKREKTDVDDVADLLDKRIRSLSPNHVIVKFVDDHDYIAAATAADSSLRALRALVDYGVPGPKNDIVRKAAADCVAAITGSVITSDDRDHRVHR